jgi:outer membrane receptor for ferrienterochelin and colicins
LLRRADKNNNSQRFFGISIMILPRFGEPSPRWAGFRDGIKRRASLGPPREEDGMRARNGIWIGILAALTLMTGAAWAQGAGQIEGKIVREANDQGIGGVTVVVSELGLVEMSNNDGAFRFAGVPAGTYNLTFSLGDNQENETVEVAGGQVATVAKKVPWDPSFLETITVFSASRRRERIVDAPASVTLITPEDIAREDSTGQLPKVLEFAPGVDVAQSGIHDFNLNARGFNSSLNRRVQVLIDGQDPAVHFLGSTEWSFLSNMTDLASAELVRGPSSALYGANAFNGVLNLVTKAPKDMAGGQLGLTAGELQTIRGDFNYGFGFGDEWYAKVSAAYTEGESYYIPRVTSVEYAGLARERVAGTGDYDSTHLQLRLDKYFSDGRHLATVEAGHFESFGGVVVTGIGRVQINDGERRFYRANYSTEHFNFLAYDNSRETFDQDALATGGKISLDTAARHAEAQANGSFFGGKLRLVGGASYRETEIDTANPQGQQTLIFAPVDTDSQAVFAQADFQLGDSLKLVLAGRWDDSTLHDAQVSPKAALVWSIDNNNTIRLSYNEAFQVGNYSEYFLNAPTFIPGNPPIASVNLAAIEAGLCTRFGVVCGFGTPVQVRAYGNKDLELEEIKSYELGYTGIFGQKAFLTVDYYKNEMENFITDLLPNPGGRVNPNYGPYRAPANHPNAALLIATLRGALPASLFAFLSNNDDGRPVFALASYTNAGQVDTEGIDLGLNYYINQDWLMDFSYSWFDFEIVDLGNVTQQLTPNTPENKFSLGVTYSGDRWGFAVKYRWVEEFFWEAGSAFAGTVPEYEVVNVNGHYDITDKISLAVNVSNALDDKHWESFGGDIVRRRALGTVTFRF